MCNICQTAFTPGDNRFDNQMSLRRPHCQHTLERKKDRKHFVIYKCVNPICSYYLNNLKKVDKEDLQKDYGKTSALCIKAFVDTYPYEKGSVFTTMRMAFQHLREMANADTTWSADHSKHPTRYNNRMTRRGPVVRETVEYRSGYAARICRESSLTTVHGKKYYHKICVFFAPRNNWYVTRNKKHFGTVFCVF